MVRPHEGHSIGNDSGRVSGGIWVMDADGPAAVDWMECNAPKTTVYVHTRRGRHAYFMAPAGVEIAMGLM